MAALDLTVGGEIQKTRPCVAVSPNEMNDHLRTVIVAPMTIGSHPARFRISVIFQRKHGLIVLDQFVPSTASGSSSEWAPCEPPR